MTTPTKLELNQTDHMTKPAIQRLEAWMMEVTALLAYQPGVPMEHKTELVHALKAFQKEINHRRKHNEPR